MNPTNKPEVLHYSKQSRAFYFASDDMNALKIHRAGKSRMPDNSWVYTLPAIYPSGLEALKDFKILFPQGQATKQAIKQITHLKSVPQKLEDLTTVNNLDYTFKIPPYLHQLTALEYMLNYSTLALVLDMGLGKTFISVHYLDITKQKAIVFAPVIVLDTWESEVRKYTDLRPLIYRGTKKQREKLRTRIIEGEGWDLIITNYEAGIPRGSSTEDFKFFMERDYPCVIVDEASRLLGHKSQRANAVDNIAGRAKNRYLLSGTLSKGKPTDIFMPFKIMDSEILGSNFWKFRGKYCKFSPYNKHILTGYKNLDVLKAKIQPYMLCMQKEDCLDLPDRTFIQAQYHMSNEQQAVYYAIRDNKVVYLPLKGTLKPSLERMPKTTHGEVRCSMAIVKLNKLQQVLSGFITLSPERDFTLCNTCKHLLECMESEFEVFPWNPKCHLYNIDNPAKKPSSIVLEFKNNGKMELLEDTLLDLGVDEDLKTKCIIWAQYRRDIAQIATKLASKGIKYITPDDKGCEQRFQTEPDTLVFLGQVNKGIGITLTAAKTTINYSYPLELEHRSQSLDRNYRIGQNSKVMVKDLVHPNSVESGILAMLDKKEDVKAFMQSSDVCKTCSNSMVCFESGIRAYSKECKYYGVRKEAERTEKIAII